jgi:hypothetical protein
MKKLDEELQKEEEEMAEYKKKHCCCYFEEFIKHKCLLSNLYNNDSHFFSCSHSYFCSYGYNGFNTDGIWK